MLRNCRATRAEVLRELADRLRTLPQQAKYLPPCRVGDRTKNRLTSMSNISNHLVTIMVTKWFPSIKRYYKILSQARAVAQLYISSLRLQGLRPVESQGLFHRWHPDVELCLAISSW